MIEKPQRYFKVLKKLTDEEIKEYTEQNEQTLHVTEREDRRKAYKQLEVGAQVCAGYLVDRQHDNGPEVHVMYNTAKIDIFNAKTKKFISFIAARPGQIKRYFDNGTWEEWQRTIYRRALYNFKNNLNYK